MTISLIVAVADNGVIGKKDALLPWRLPADLARFKRLTMGHTIIMGRKTYDTIGRALPGRQNIVISRDQNYSLDGCDSATSIKSALEKSTSEEVFIIGGGEIFKQALPLATKLYMTRVHSRPEGDVTFTYNETEWKEVSSEDHTADDKNEFAYSFTDLIRKT